jgi:hypothetical protein
MVNFTKVLSKNSLQRCYNTQSRTVNQVDPCVGHVVITCRKFKNWRSFAKMVQLSVSLNGNTRTHMHARTHKPPAWRSELPSLRRKEIRLKPGTHYLHVTWDNVLFSTPSLSLPMRWFSYADLYNLVTWCHKKGPLAHFFNKHFLHFWKQLVTSAERSTRTSRLMKCVWQQKFERGVLVRELTRALSEITWHKQSDTSVNLRHRIQC